MIAIYKTANGWIAVTVETVEESMLIRLTTTSTTDGSQ